MKKILIWLVVDLLMLTSCNTVHYVTPSVNLISENSGMLKLRSTGISNEKYNAIAEAEKNAILEILFVGIPNSQYKDAMIVEQKEVARSKYARYFKNLLDEAGYKTFIISSIPTTEQALTVKGKKVMTTDVVVNIRALRQSLEKNGVIRKFGY